jgi:thiol-disulfide isomerase/thioredoxin
MKKIWSLILSIGFIFFSVNSEAQTETPNIADPRLDFSVLKTNGDSLKLSSMKGKVFLLDFWASWCGPCRASNKQLLKLYAKYKTNGFEILSVSLDEDMSDWKKAIAKDKITWMQGIDTRGWDAVSAGKWQVEAIPASFLIDKSGNVVAINLEKDELEIKVRTIILSSLILFSVFSEAQELFPYTEPASNMPAKSLGLKLGAMYGKGPHSDRILQRYAPEVMFGLNKKLMIHANLTFSDMHESYFYYESARIYAKYRFLSKDDVHKHFRMAAFASAAYSRNHLDHNEINLMGDQSGVQLGVIATQLWNKFALSGTFSGTEVLDETRSEKNIPQQYAYEALNYSLSAGYLVFPRNYSDYKQTNFNIYAELLGGRNLDWEYERYFLDLAPSVQFIFNSASKLNIGYRFQLRSDIYRLMKNSFMVSYDHIFLNALKKKK